jgi:hypothetical protein
MRVRSILAALLVLSLAVTPAAARAAFAVNDGHAGASHSDMAAQEMMAAEIEAMPDCHRMMMQLAEHKPAPVKSDNHKNCPDCDKRGACAADICQLKCFKVLGALHDEDRAAQLIADKFSLSPQAALEARSYKPRTPPPRT